MCVCVYVYVCVCVCVCVCVRPHPKVTLPVSFDHPLSPQWNTAHSPCHTLSHLVFSESGIPVNVDTGVVIVEGNP